VTAREYSELYGTVVQDDLAFYEPTEFAPPTGAFYIVQAEGRTVAGGALRRLAASVGEIKRMWTAPSHRGRGYARRVLAGLEDVAVGYGYGAVRLETGALQVAAIALYRSAGYEPIAP
jgi:GNAT superfamily N-acetyltransferase